MNEHRFDDLAKALATGTSRRGVLKGLAGGAAGTALAVLSGRDADAKRKKPKKSKKGAAQGEPCNATVCGPGEFCCNFSCSICAPLGSSCTQQFCGDEGAP